MNPMAREPALSASLWAASAPPAAETPPLDGDTTADVVIIGGGFTGCSTALHLALEGVCAILLEAEESGQGGSGRNAGLVNAGLWLDPEEVVRRAGAVHGQRIVDGLDVAPMRVYEIVERYGIDCDLVRKGVIKGAHSPAGMRELEEHARQWQARGADVEVVDKARVAEMTGIATLHGGIIDHRSASIQPLSYVRGLARAALTEGARLHTGTRVTKLEQAGDGWRVTTPGGTVTAGSVVLATNAYSDGLWPGVKESTIPIGAYLYASEPMGENMRRTVLPAGHGMYDSQKVVAFSRLDRDHRLLIGSLGYSPRSNPERASAWAGRFLDQRFPQMRGTKWSYSWAGTIGFTPDHLPRLHEPAPGLHIPLGYNGRGIAPGTFWGRILAARITGTPAEEMPLPVTAVRPVRGRALWTAFYEAAFSAYRLRNMVR
jgi:glycine/D-amino acid oxidase-like deaminating enzyme